MEREQFTFYASFAKAVQRIRKAADRCAAYDAIVNYALFEQTPDLDKLPDAAAIAFELIRPNLDSSRKKAENGKAGGKKEARPKQTESKAEAPSKQEQTASKKENEKEGEKEKENECSISPPTPSAEDFFSGDLLQAVKDWLSYKRERREAYKPTGLKTLLSQLRKAADQYGDAAVVDVIRNSIASNYAGVTLDRLASSKSPPAKSRRYTTAAEYAAQPKAGPTREDLDAITRFLKKDK